jgi:hypothetical protein
MVQSNVTKRNMWPEVDGLEQSELPSEDLIEDEAQLGRERERVRERERDRETERHRERERDRQTERDRERETESERERQRERDRERERQRETGTERERQRQRETERETETWEAHLFVGTNKPIQRAVESGGSWIKKVDIGWGSSPRW